MFTNWNKAVDEWEAATAKNSRQTVIIVVLSVLLVVLALGITLLIFKLKDMMEDDGLDMRQRTPVRRSGDRPVRPSGSSQARSAGSRPSGTRLQGQDPPQERREADPPVRCVRTADRHSRQEQDLPQEHRGADPPARCVRTADRHSRQGQDPPQERREADPPARCVRQPFGEAGESRCGGEKSGAQHSGCAA